MFEVGKIQSLVDFKEFVCIHLGIDKIVLACMLVGAHI